MGIRHLAHVLYNTNDIPPTAKLVLVALADHINDESGWGWPSLNRLATLCGINRRNTLKWIDWLEQHGHIEVRRRPGWANHYRLTRVASDTSVGRDTGGVSHATTGGVASDTQTRRTRREPGAAPQKAGATPTPPPIHEVLLHLDQYR